jgi:hypothetical protein
MITATPESIALAAGLIGQTKGDLAQARRAAGEAFAWLQSIDPSYKPEPVKSAAPDTAAAERIADLEAACAMLERENLSMSNLTGKLRDDLTDWQDRALTAETKRDALKAELDGFKLRTAIASDSASKPQPAPQAPVKASPVQTPAADPYAGLPPKMRAFLATQASKLEID